MHPRFFVSLLAVLLFSSTLPSLAAEDCPACGGRLSNVGAITDDRAQPSKNLAVWNRSICANLFYGDDSLICTQCWMAHSKNLQTWERSSALPNSFHRPLSPATRDFPLPPASNIKSTVVYSQKLTDMKVTESILFWCSNSPTFLSSVRAYAREHQLSLRIEVLTERNAVIVAAQTKG
jgi:hypothetical protein